MPEQGQTTCGHAKGQHPGMLNIAACIRLEFGTYSYCPLRAALIKKKKKKRFKYCKRGFLFVGVLWVFFPFAITCKCTFTCKSSKAKLSDVCDSKDTAHSSAVTAIDKNQIRYFLHLIDYPKSDNTHSFFWF